MDIFTVAFLASVFFAGLTMLCFLGGLVVFFRRNTFRKDQNVIRRFASTRPVIIADDELASASLTLFKKSVAGIKGIWTGLNPALKLFFKCQIPTAACLTISICSMMAAIADLLIVSI